MKEFLVGFLCLPVYQAFFKLRMDYIKIDPDLIIQFMEVKQITDPLYQTLIYYGYLVSIPTFSCALLSLMLIHFLCKRLCYTPFTMALCFLVTCMFILIRDLLYTNVEQEIIIATMAAITLSTLSFSARAKKYLID